ncbi:MAG: hypothetical protein LBQ05_02185 [Christensenellaceae bacterium]|jgi:hypothetical protein|nr:hypothetical protein [Christensenellaceae bacterium]
MRKVFLIAVFFVTAIISATLPTVESLHTSHLSATATADTTTHTTATNSFGGFNIKTMSIGGENGSETIETPLYVKDKYNNDKRAFYLDEIGIIVDENKNPIVSDGTVMNTYNEVTGEVVDGANRAMVIWLDSVNNKHYIKQDGLSFNKSITLTDTVYMINYGGTVIYATREERKRDWYEYVPFVNIFTSLREKYLWYDMNGRELDTKKIEEVKNSWWAKTAEVFVAINTLGVSEYWSVLDYTAIKDQMTLAELDTLLTHATENPWNGLTDGNGLPVVTEDGFRVRVNPRTSQLYSGGGLVFPIFNSISGLPIIFINNDIITTDGQQQTITNCVLTNSTTVQNLLNTGCEFYMDTITTQYGRFDCPVLVQENGDRTLITGQSTNGITDGFYMWYESPDVGQDFSEWWQEITDSGFLTNLKMILTIIAIVFVVMLLLPIIPPIINLVSVPFVILADSIKSLAKKSKGKK